MEGTSLEKEDNEKQGLTHGFGSVHHSEVAQAVPTKDGQGP